MLFVVRDAAKKSPVGWLFLGAILTTTANAFAEPRPYRGPHPVEANGDWHDDPEVHVHDDLPVGLAPFVEVEGVLVFLGDPEAYGYDGTRYRYSGAHPLPAAFGANCGIRGEHEHPFVPEGSYRLDDGVYHFTGALRGGTPTRTPSRLAPTEAELEAGGAPPAAYVVPVLPYLGRAGRPCRRFRAGTRGSARAGCLRSGRRARPYATRDRRRSRRGSVRRAGDPPDRGRRARRRSRREDWSTEMGRSGGDRRVIPDAASARTRARARSTRTIRVHPRRSTSPRR